MVLFKMLNRGMFCAINGCISTGKEANVYHAVNAAGENFAIKVYKTSILVFKDRDRCCCPPLRCSSLPYCGINLNVAVSVTCNLSLEISSISS